MRYFVFSILLLVLTHSPALAADEEKKTTPPIMQEIGAFVSGLDKVNSRHANMLFSNYNLVLIVKSVEDSVEKAVDKCGEENPDLKDALETRFDEWKGAVNPVLKEAESHTNNMVHAQEYAKASKIKKLFKGLKKARKASGKEVEKVPVSTPEACEFLKKSMDKTQPEMVRILRQTHMSLPQQMEEEAAAEKKKAAEKAKAAEEAEKAKEDKAEDS